MPMKRTQPTRAAPVPAKRKRIISDDEEEDDDDDELSDPPSDLDLSDDDIIEPSEEVTSPSEDEDEEGVSSVSSPAEESYSDSEDDTKPLSSTLKFKKPPRTTKRSCTTINRRAPASAKPNPKLKTLNSKKKPATGPATPTIKLKITSDKLRLATSNWTPPPAPIPSSKPTASTRAMKSTAKPTIEDSSSDSELSNDEEMNDIDAEGEDEEEEDAEGDDDDEDAEGDDDEEMLLGEEDAEGETDEDAEGETDDETPAGTEFGGADLTRLTNRQRTRMGDITTADHLLELPSGYEKSGTKPVTLSAHEQELKRAEMARRRKNLTDQRLEEEKMDTINRLLKKQTPKMRRGNARNTGTAGDATPANKEEAEAMGIEMPPPPTMARWVSNKDGARLMIPQSWIGAPAGRMYEPMRTGTNKRKLVEEV